MSMTLDSRTRASLLGAAADPANQEARAAFVECYASLIRDWCCRWGIQEADQANVFQTMLCRLFEMLPTFQYDRNKGRFRGLLRTMTHHAIVNLHRERQRHPGICGSGDSEVLGRLNEVPDPDDPAVEELAQNLAGQVERHQQLHEACKRVRLRVKPHTWQAFWLTTVEGMPVSEVAERLGMTEVSVSVAKYRVRERLRSEFKGTAGREGRGECPSGSS